MTQKQQQRTNGAPADAHPQVGARHEIRPASDTERGPDADLEVVVGLPAYNEAVGIGSTILGAQEFADEVIVVDDGSTDRTVEIAVAAGATVVQHQVNKGKGGAVKTLLELAAERDPGVFVLLDADGQHLPSDTPTVIHES